MRTLSFLKGAPEPATESLRPSGGLAGEPACGARSFLDRLFRLFLLVALAAGAFATSYTGIPLSAPHLVAYVLALVALVAAAECFDRGRPAAKAETTAPFTRLDALLLAVGTIPAVALRLLWIDRIPPLIWSDEITYLQNAVGVLEGNLVSLFVSGHWDAVYLHPYSIAAAMLLVPDRTVALRLVSVIPGALSVPLQYLFLRHLFGNRALAFIGSALLALSSWHILLSRQGYHWSINGFAELIALYWLVRALRSNRMRHFVLSGLGLGLGVVYTYSAMLMPIVVGLFAGYLLLMHRSLVTRRLVVGFAFLTLGAALVAGPRLTTVLTHPNMIGRHNSVSVLSSPRFAPQAAEIIPRQMKEILLSFNHRSDEGELFHPRGREPLLDPVTASAFGLGAFYALFRFRKPGWALLLLTFVVLLLPSVFSAGQTNWATAWRANGVVPGLFGLATAPFAVVWQLGAGTGVVRRGVIALFTLVFGVIGALNYHYYFVVHPAKPGWPIGAVALQMQAAQRLLDASPETRLLVNQDLAGSWYLTTLPYGHRSYSSFAWPDVDPLPPLLADDGRPVLVLASALRDYQRVTAGDTLIDLLVHYYPDGQRDDRRDPRGRAMYSTYLLQPAQIRAGHGLAVRYTSSAGATVDRPASFAMFDWRLPPTSSFPFVASIQGTLVVPVEGAYEVALLGVEKHETRLNGRPFASGYLLPGLYEIVVRAEVGRPTSVQLAWRRDGGPITPVPPSSVLVRGLPPWGIVEEYTLAGAGGETQRRWLPALWFETPGRKTSTQPLRRIEWAGDATIPVDGAYRLYLLTQAKATVWVDGQELPARAGVTKEWELRLTAGWHRLRAAVDAPDWQDFRLYWLGPGDRREVIGGLTARPAR
ncbi:MAG: glycosyltransferase family 39 protein [Chloroflexi bacterium]|nr:glycosyltransferase family 39 protein [Chloroflexota bacterium]